MDVTLDGEIRVALSHRNLKDLMRQTETRANTYLDPEGSELAQLVRSCAQLNGDTYFLRVVVEEDETHYGERERGPGVHGNEV